MCLQFADFAAQCGKISEKVRIRFVYGFGSSDDDRAGASARCDCCRHHDAVIVVTADLAAGKCALSSDGKAAAFVGYVGSEL